MDGNFDTEQLRGFVMCYLAKTGGHAYGAKDTLGSEKRESGAMLTKYRAAGNGAGRVAGEAV
jgi:hypothetical protein